mmetsp:Transcript_7353/g.10840  ORF Transcript_7353/g.10840 Transcript_7353/m.10840 type:complete len:413 (+) Transcript_7353:107-1345(+)
MENHMMEHIQIQHHYIQNHQHTSNQQKNGHYYTVGEGDDMYDVIHVYGTPYEMGYAQGQLMKEKLRVFLPAIFDYLQEEIGSNIPKNIPEWLRKYIAEYGLDVALDMTYELVRFYTNEKIFEEMKGLADATGIDYYMIRRIHLIGELTQGKCSMMGAWGEATEAGKTIQLRAFDWDVKGPFKNYPSVTVYHPNEGNGHPFINIGFVGFVASFSGMSSEGLGISEIGIYYPDESFGGESRIGNAFVFLLRDILQYDQTLDDSITRMATTRRTCDLALGVGDGKLGTFRGFAYSHDSFQVLDDINAKPKNDSWHPPIKNVYYLGMDWLCPPYNLRLGEQIKKYHGKINPEVMMQQVVPMTTTGNLQVSIYDLTEQVAYVSYARGDNEDGPAYAYDRRYIRIDTKQLWNVTKPAL